MKYIIKYKKYCIAIFTMIFAIICLIIVFNKTIQKNSNDKVKYISEITVETVEENKNNYYTINLENDGSAAKANTNFKSMPIYMTKDAIIYSEDGRFKKVLSDLCYKDIYNILTKNIDLTSDGNFYPLLKKDSLNQLFKSLFIQYEIDKDYKTNVIIRNNKIEYFSIYLNDILGFKNMNIIITFEYLEDYKINIPVFYKEVIDEVDKNRLNLFQNT